MLESNSLLCCTHNIVAAKNKKGLLDKPKQRKHQTVTFIAFVPFLFCLASSSAILARTLAKQILAHEVVYSTK